MNENIEQAAVMAAAETTGMVPGKYYDLQPEAAPKGMNGWVVAGTAVGGTLLGGLLMWGVPKLIRKFFKKGGAQPVAGSNEQGQAQKETEADAKADKKNEKK